MSDPPIRSAIDELLALDPSSCDRDGLARAVLLCERARSWVASVEVHVARRTRELAAAGTSEPPADLLGACGRRSARDAKAADARADVCSVLTGFTGALEDGSVSTGHVDALANAASSLDDDARDRLREHEDHLLALAASVSVATFDRRCRELARRLDRDEGERRLDEMKRLANVRRWVDRRSGMWHLHAELDPERGAALWSALDDRLATVRQRDDTSATPLDRLAADALVEVATGARSSDPNVPELCLHMDLRTLLDGLHDASISETSNGEFLPPESIRRLACEAVIVPIVCDGDGVPLDVGAARRTATREQRRALRAMYRTCGHPGCAVPFDDCRIHHVIPWQVERLTDLANLLPLCSKHHHLVHEGGWRLTMTPDRVVTLTRPDGTVVHAGSTVDRVATTRPAAA
jgi:hypothetical protein